jgi:Tol biopolymer transport system component
VPEAADRAVHKALEKLPADRWSSAQAFAAAIASTDSAPVSARPNAAGDRRTQLAVVLVAALASVVAAWGWLRHPASPAPPPSRLSIVVPSGTSFPGGSRLIDIAADGSRVVFYSSNAQNSIVELQDLDAVEPVRIKGTEGGLDLHLSRDGAMLYFGDGTVTQMNRVNLAGGAPARLQGIPSTPFLAFAPSGSIWLSMLAGTVGQIDREGRLHPRFTGDTLGKRVAVMQVLPSEREALVKEYDSNEGLLYALDLRSGKLTQLLDFAISEARFVQGFLLYVRNDGQLNAVAYDPDRHKTTGSPVQIASDVNLSGSGIAQFAAAENGTIVYVPTQPRELVVVDRAGVARPLTPEKRNYHQPRLSPDGKSILVDFATPEGRDVWLMDRAAGTMMRVTSDHDGHDASWSPDGKSIMYASVKQGVYSILSTRPGSGRSDLLIADKRLTAWPGRWLPDGKQILSIATDMQPNSGADIVLVDSARQIRPLVVTSGADQWTDISPNGRWLAYTSNVSGQSEVYVRPMAGNDQIQISVSGGAEPMWSRDGRELFYRAVNGAHQVLASATIQTEPSLAVTARQNLFSVDEYDPAQPHSNYDVSADGRSFFMVRRGPVGRIVVIQNLVGLVRRLQGGAATPRG